MIKRFYFRHYVDEVVGNWHLTYTSHKIRSQVKNNLNQDLLLYETGLIVPAKTFGNDYSPVNLKNNKVLWNRTLDCQ